MSADSTDYEKYAGNDAHMDEYMEYQSRYHSDARESDKVILDIVSDIAGKSEGGISLLDAGCSTGALLKHIKSLGLDISLMGADLSDVQIENCRKNPDLNGIEFEVLDILKLGESGPRFDIITLNAVIFCFSNDILEKAFSSLKKALKPGGKLVLFDLVHPIEQDLEIVEKSAAFPEGLIIMVRSETKLTAAFKESGFSEIEYRPFKIPIDLPFKGNHTIETYTIATEPGSRLLMRGAIAQPWTHIIASTE